MGSSVSAGYDHYDDYKRLCERKGVTPIHITYWNQWEHHEKELEGIADQPPYERIISALARDKRNQAEAVKGEIVNLQNKLKILESEADSLDIEVKRMKEIRGLKNADA